MSEAGTTIVVPSTHPALLGHFPGNPIVPGVLLLGYIAAALDDAYGPLIVQGAPQVKFLAPLRPDVSCTVRFVNVREDRADFTCHVGEAIIARGSFAIARPSGAR